MTRRGGGKDSEVDLVPYEVVGKVPQNVKGKNGILLYSKGTLKPKFLLYNA